jgi:hypothetical protein
MQPVVDSIHELFVGVEALGSQSDLHLDEEMVIAWRQVRTGRRMGENLPVGRLIEGVHQSKLSVIIDHLRRAHQYALP